MSDSQACSNGAMMSNDTGARDAVVRQLLVEVMFFSELCSYKYIFRFSCNVNLSMNVSATQIARDGLN